MSMTLNVPVAEGALSRARRLYANLQWGIATVVRAPRRRTNPAWRRAGRLVPYGIVLLGVIVASMFYVDGWVAEIMVRRPDWLRTVFEGLTEFGRSGWFLVPTGLIWLAVAFVSSRAMVHVDRLVLATIGFRVGFLFLAIALPSLFVTVIKRIIGRARPLVGEQIDPLLFQQWVWRPDYASLPSGHATTAFAAAVAIGVLWPRLRVAMFIYAFLIALSRVVLDAHYVSDVLAGAIVGVVGALLVRDRFAERRLVFSVGLDGRVGARSGLSLAHVKTVARKVFAP
jgi:undecaprenyl-diphosphatase